MVRGVAIAQPLSIRILLEERPSSRPLTLRGEKISVNGDEGRDSELVCSWNEKWQCKTKSRKKIRGIVSLTSSDHFIHIGSAFYRNKIDLIPKGNKLLIVNELDLESYLVGIVNSEISSKYPREAIKAQIVAARSYAMACAADRRKRNLPYDLDTSEMDQVYKGAQVEDPMSHFAVLETKGEVLKWKGNILKAYYSASSGGMTERPEDVWGSSTQYERGAYDSSITPLEARDEDFSWRISFGPAIGFRIPGLGMLRDLQVVEKSDGERVRKLLLIGDQTSKILSGNALRKIFGARWLKSTLFQVDRKGNRWIIEGRGFGHGVGLSQIGARNLAKKGWNYKKILSAYYPASKIDKLQLYVE